MMPHMIHSMHALGFRINKATVCLLTCAVTLGIVPRSEAAADPAITQAVSAAATTDIEDIVNNQAKPISNLIGGASPQISMNSTNVLALSQGLANAILNKQSNLSDPNDRNRVANKADEIGEVAAVITHGIAGNAKFQ